MRVPHTIPVNTLRAYAASDQTVALQAERYRTIRAEDLSWDEVVPPSLVSICVQVLAANFVQHREVLPFLMPQDFDYFLEILSVDLPLHDVAPIIQDGIYWKRCCASRWPNQPLDSSKYSGSWKRMYIEKFCEEYIHDQEPGYIDWEDVRKVMACCAPFVYRLDIKELKPPRKWSPKPNLPDECIRGKIDPDHLDLGSVLPILENLAELSVKFGLLDCGMNYNPECFRISLNDVTNLGEGLKNLRFLSSFRCHRCAIDDIRVNILITALMSCSTLETLELSNCKFGDIGAKSLGKLLIEHNNLKTLSVQNNKISEEGAEGLAYALQHETCCPIQCLMLDFNIIGDHGGEMLSTAIVKNRTLKELYLGGVGMTDIGAIKIAEALLFSARIQVITLINNHLTIVAGEYLVAAVQNNRRIETLDVRNCGIGEEAETAIHKLITRNRLHYRPN